MNNVEVKQAPLLAGWAIAMAAGVVAAAVSMVVIGLNLTQAVFVGVILLTVVGVILGLPRAEAAEADMAPVMQHPAARAPATPAPAHPAPAVPAPVVVAPVVPAPVMETPAAAAPAMAEPATLMARRPEAMAGARGGMPDDLKQIKGVGPVLENLLHSLGFYHFDQVAAWTSQEVAWVDENLEGFKGRVTRDEWVAQARVLAAGGNTEFSRRVEDGEVH